MNFVGKFPSIFSSPLHGFIKLNFDGASKGNIGLVGYGGIFRDDNDGPICFYVGRCGNKSNNVGEFIAMDHYLIIALDNGYQRLHIDGDPLLVLSMVNKLLNGLPIHKFIKIW